MIKFPWPRLLHLFLIIPLPTFATDVDPNWTYGVLPFQGEYMLYGGSLGDLTQPSQKDAKVFLALYGKVAADMFSSMKADTKNDCDPAAGNRYRERAGLSCRKMRNGKYSCHIGFDLKTGKSIGGIIC